MMDVINAVAWIGANIFLAYIAVVIVLFVLMYYIFFDPKATTAGRMIFRFMLSLVGIIGLVYVGVFVNPSAGNGPFSGPTEHVELWRPILRFVVYGYVAWTISSLALALVMRKWFPDKVKKKSDLDLVRPRSDTTDIPIIGQ